MSWVEFCEIRKIWQQLIYLEVSTLVQGCGQALIYRLHHQYQDHHFVFHMMICWAFPNNKKKLYPENIFCNGEDWFEFELAQIQFNFIPGQRAKLQLVGQSIQCSECELHIQRKWKYKQIIINTQSLERASVPQCSYHFLPFFCVVFKIWFDNIISPNYLAKYISSRLSDYWWIVMDCRQPPLRSDWPSKKSAATAFQKLWRNILKIFLPWLSSSQEERTF